MNINDLFGHGINFEERRGVSMTEYRISGERDAVLITVGLVFAEYAGLAYGTRVNEMTQRSDGSYCARMSRGNSGD